LVLYFDNARPHIARCIDVDSWKSNEKGSPAAFSPNLAPSDFYRFGTLKNSLKGCVFEDENEFLQAITSLNVHFIFQSKMDSYRPFFWSAIRPLARIVLDVEFHKRWCSANGPIATSNWSARFRLGDRFHNYYPILYVQISPEWGSRCSRHQGGTSDKVYSRCVCTLAVRF
jgi:hypothetical protein